MADATADLCVRCSPGRFLAVAAIKTILAHMILRYDFKAQEEGQVPPALVTKTACMPNPAGKVFLRRRATDIMA